MTVFNIRRMAQADLTGAYQLSQTVGWPHRLEDWQQAAELGEGWVVIRHQRVIGCGILWRWGEKRGTLGLVIVAPSEQGRGVGKQLLKHCLEHYPEMVIRLHATAAGKTLYQQCGFIAQGKVYQHQTPCFTLDPALNVASDGVIRTVQADELLSLAKLDQQAHGFWRLKLWQQLYHTAEQLVVVSKGQQLLGAAGLRRFGHGWVVGPLLAADITIAKQLFIYCAAPLVGQFVRIDTYADRPFSSWLSDLGLPVVDCPLLMVRGARWRNPAAQCQDFAFMSQAMA